MTVRVKICGITCPEDAMNAVASGADAIGLVFYSGSKRAVNVETARAIVAVLPAFVSVVGLFVNASEQEVEEVLQYVPIDILQFHGDETDDFCQSFRRPYLKAVRVRHELDIQTACNLFPHARALLFDAYHPDEYGGTGLQFDWNLLSDGVAKPWVLAGGLMPDNVATAIAISGAQAVDVSGGVESSPGRKDAAKMTAFVKAAKQLAV